MFSQYFGQYLFNEGILSAEQLYNIFKYKENIRVKLGTLAMTSGLVTAAQVEEILNIQKAGSPKRFGEIAVEKGYLSIAQVEQLLNAQKTTQVNLSQAIADQGYLSLGEIEKHLENFYHQQQAQSVNAITQMKTIEPKDIEAVVSMFLNFSEVGGNAKWYYKYMIFTLENISKFLDESPALYRMSYGMQAPFSKRHAAKNKNTVYNVITQSFPGAVNLKVSTVKDEATFAEIYKRLSKHAPEEAAKAKTPLEFVCEQFNQHNNKFWSTVVLPELGAATSEKLPEKLLPPEASEEKEPFNGSYKIPVRFSFGVINFLLENVIEEEEDV